MSPKSLFKSWIVFILMTGCLPSSYGQQPDPYLHKLYDSLHDSPNCLAIYE